MFLNALFAFAAVFAISSEEAALGLYTELSFILIFVLSFFEFLNHVTIYVAHINVALIVGCDIVVAAGWPSYEPDLPNLLFVSPLLSKIITSDPTGSLRRVLYSQRQALPSAFLSKVTEYILPKPAAAYSRKILPVESNSCTRLFSLSTTMFSFSSSVMPWGILNSPGHSPSLPQAKKFSICREPLPCCCHSSSLSKRRRFCYSHVCRHIEMPAIVSRRSLLYQSTLTVYHRG